MPNIMKANQNIQFPFPVVEVLTLGVAFAFSSSFPSDLIVVFLDSQREGCGPVGIDPQHMKVNQPVQFPYPVLEVVVFALSSSTSLDFNAMLRSLMCPMLFSPNLYGHVGIGVDLLISFPFEPYYYGVNRLIQFLFVEDSALDLAFALSSSMDGK